jgi:peptidoglycan-associated lipoprotein
MKRACARLLTPSLLVMALCLMPPRPASAGAPSPSTVSSNERTQEMEAVPEGIYTQPAYHYLNRLVFRYENVHFDFNSSVLLPTGQHALRRKVRWLQEHPEATVLVEGHCDERGSAAYNFELGVRRSEAARAFLIKEGIAPGRIQIVSRGKTRPEAPGRGEPAWSRNRRAEFLPH